MERTVSFFRLFLYLFVWSYSPNKIIARSLSNTKFLYQKVKGLFDKIVAFITVLFYSIFRFLFGFVLFVISFPLLLLCFIFSLLFIDLILIAIFERVFLEKFFSGVIKNNDGSKGIKESYLSAIKEREKLLNEKNKSINSDS